MPTPEEHARRVAVALSTPQVPRAQRVGRVSPTREVVCRGCGRWIHQPSPEIGWVYEDGTPACMDPLTLVRRTQGAPTA